MKKFIFFVSKNKQKDKLRRNNYKCITKKNKDYNEIINNIININNPSYINNKFTLKKEKCKKSKSLNIINKQNNIIGSNTSIDKIRNINITNKKRLRINKNIINNKSLCIKKSVNIKVIKNSNTTTVNKFNYNIKSNVNTNNKNYCNFYKTYYYNNFDYLFSGSKPIVNSSLKYFSDYLGTTAISRQNNNFESFNKINISPRLYNCKLKIKKEIVSKSYWLTIINNLLTKNNLFIGDNDIGYYSHIGFKVSNNKKNNLFYLKLKFDINLNNNINKKSSEIL